MIETALADYTARCELAPLKRYPRVWAGHYSDDRCLGQMALAQIPEIDDTRGASIRIGNIAFGLLLPFGLSPEIDESYIIFDDWATPGGNPALQVSEIRAEAVGVRATHYRVPVEVATRGVSFGEPRVCWPQIPGVDRAVSRVLDRRMTASSSFTDAYHAAIIVFEETFG